MQSVSSGMNTLICGNGRSPSATLMQTLSSWTSCIIAADGGALTLHTHGITPDFIIGDMDSYPDGASGLHSADTRIIPDPDQETNDLEKALHLAKKHHSTDIILCGFTGFRLDHTLKNLSVMQQFTPLFHSIAMVDDFCASRIIPRSFNMRINPGCVISLFPLSGKVDGITTSGLKYSLDNEPIENGLRDGSSNEATKEVISIEHRSGALLLMIPMTWPLPF